jgi:hypothetical protein
MRWAWDTFSRFYRSREIGGRQQRTANGKRRTKGRQCLQRFVGNCASAMLMHNLTVSGRFEDGTGSVSSHSCSQQQGRAIRAGLISRWRQHKLFRTDRRTNTVFNSGLTVTSSKVKISLSFEAHSSRQERREETLGFSKTDKPTCHILLSIQCIFYLRVIARKDRNTGTLQSMKQPGLPSRMETYSSTSLIQTLNSETDGKQSDHTESGDGV